ncbi:MAG: DNA polymerase II [Thermoproteota archaeon]|jgi:DNA-binding protein H-NS|nr:DNA polymerase II [Thermoproteota archaeon]
MGRTQPSLTRIIDLELEKLDKIANKLRDEELAEIIKEAKENVRKIEEAVQDELVDPLEVILLAFLVSNRLRNRRNT